MLEAYASSDRKCLALKFRVEVRDGHAAFQDRWLHLERPWVDKAILKDCAQRTLRGSIVFGPHALDGRVSKRPKWDVAQMVRLEARRVKSPQEIPVGAFIGVWDPANTPEDERPHSVQYYFVMARAREEGGELLEVDLPRREFRTPGGYIVQVFQPFMWAADIMLFPVYLPYLIGG